MKCIEDEIPFELPKGWAWSKIGPLCEYITSGSRGWAQYYSEAGILFLRMGNLSRESFDLRLENIQRVNLPDSVEGTRTRVVENDLLFSITAEIGMLGLIPANFEEAYINQHVGLIRFLKEAQTKYFPYILMSEFCRDQYYAVQSGMKNSFRLDNVQNILIPVPPLSEQIRIAKKLSSIWTHVQQIDVESETASDIISKAKSKILDLAIRGQLVPQDPNDAPASVLLERIRAEKEALIKQGKIKRDKKESIIFKGEDNSYYALIDGISVNIAEYMGVELPDGWKWITLKDISTITSGKTPKPEMLNTNGIIPYFKVADMNTPGNELQMKYADYYINNLYAGPVFESGSFIFPKNGGAVLTNKKRILAKDSVVDLNTGVFTPSKLLNQDYIFFLFSSIDFSKIYKGAVIPTVDSSIIGNLIYGLPPVEEQIRIADTIKKLFTQLEQIEIAVS